MIKEFLIKHLLKIIGLTVGAIGGYLYYYFIGCSSGTCPITSNPYISIVYGAIMGYLLLDLFKKKENKVDGSN
jgi:predicted membrane metal-binding protein